MIEKMREGNESIEKMRVCPRCLGSGVEKVPEDKKSVPCSLCGGRGKVYGGNG
jgi:DnaJ-class molecular chaperone